MRFRRRRLVCPRRVGCSFFALVNCSVTEPERPVMLLSRFAEPLFNIYFFREQIRFGTQTSSCLLPPNRLFPSEMFLVRLKMLNTNLVNSNSFHVPSWWSGKYFVNSSTVTVHTGSAFVIACIRKMNILRNRWKLMESLEIRSKED